MLAVWCFTVFAAVGERLAVSSGKEAVVERVDGGMGRWLGGEREQLPSFFPPPVFLQRCFPAAGQCSWFGTCGLDVSLSLRPPPPLSLPHCRMLQICCINTFSAQRGPIISPSPPLWHIMYTPHSRVCLTDDSCDVEPLKALCGA